MDLQAAFHQRTWVLLKEAELFRGVSEKDYNWITNLARKRTVEDGAFFFMEEDSATTVLLLTEGRVKLTRVSPDGQQVIMGFIRPGEEFGIIAVLDDSAYPVSAQAVGDCQALSWDRGAMRQLTERIPQVSQNITRILSQKIQEYQKRIQELATQRVERRIARTLLRLAQQTGRKVGEGVLIDLPLTRQDLAEMTGTTIFTVSRTLKRWETHGLILSKREQVIIRYPHGLVCIAEDFGKWEVESDS